MQSREQKQGLKSDVKFPVAFRLNEGKNILHLKKNGIEKKDSKVKSCI